MKSENESGLHKRVFLPEYSLPLTILFDLRDFSRERLAKLTKEADMLAAAANSEFVFRQPTDIRIGLEKAADDARLEIQWWYALETKLGNLCHDALTYEE